MRCLAVLLLLLVSACATRAPLSIPTAGPRTLVWAYPASWLTWSCIDGSGTGTVSRFEVWDGATWLNAGMQPHGDPDTYSYPLADGQLYRFVRACGSGCAETCGSSGSLPATIRAVVVMDTP